MAEQAVNRHVSTREVAERQNDELRKDQFPLEGVLQGQYWQTGRHLILTQKASK